MHIGMVIDLLGVGGAERVALTLAETFLDQGHSVTFITVDNIKTIDIDKRIELYSLSFENKINKYAYNRKKMYSLLESIQKEKGTFDFILVHLYKASRVMQHYSNVQCFHIMHNTQSKSALKDKKGFKRWLIKRKIQNVYNGLDIICVSQGVQDDLINVMHVKPKTIQVIYNPFDIDSIRGKSKESYQLPFKDEYIIYVGRLVKEKRVDYLLKAYAKSEINEKLLILGDGDESEYLQSLSNALKIDHKVIFLGSTNNPYKYVKDAKFLVMCSLFEGFGNVLVEALVLQTPVISTNCPSGPKEILEHYTLNALVNDNFNNDDLADKIKEWSKAPVPVDQACMNIFFNIHIAQQYIELYYKTIDTHAHDKIRILFELSSLGYGGTEKAIYTFIENIDKNKFDVYLFFSTDYKTFPYYRRKIKSLFSKKAKERFIEKYTTYTTRLKDFQTILGESKVLIGESKYFFKIIKSIDIDIIHFNRGISETYYTKNIEQIPPHIKIVETNIFGKKANVHYLDRLDKMFFISNWLVTQTPWVPQDKIQLLYNPIKLPSSTIDLREHYGIPDNALVLGRISRPNLDDGLFIYNVLQTILKNENTYFISLAASQTFKKQMKNHKNIILIDPTTDVEFLSSFYNTIDVLLHYRKEGETFGMNIAEAMIHAKPVISHHSYLDNAQSELLLEDTKNPCGIVVKENNLEEYIKAVQTLIDDVKLRKHLSMNAKKSALARFSEDKVTNVLEDAYSSLFS